MDEARIISRTPIHADPRAVDPKTAITPSCGPASQIQGTSCRKRIVADKQIHGLRVGCDVDVRAGPVLTSGSAGGRSSLALLSSSGVATLGVFSVVGSQLTSGVLRSTRLAATGRRVLLSKH